MSYLLRGRRPLNPGSSRFSNRASARRAFSTAAFSVCIFAALLASRTDARPPEFPESGIRKPDPASASAPGNSASDPDTKVSDSPDAGETSEVFLAAREDGPVLVSWVDFRQGTRCCYALSSDGGGTWGAKQCLGPVGGGFTGDATVGVDDEGNFYRVCQDYGNSQIRLSSSVDAGKTWSAWQSIQASPDKPWVDGARNGTVFVTWLGNPGGFRRSVDGGRTWEAAKSLGNLNHGTAISSGSNGVVHIPFNQGDGLRYVRSRDWGATLEPGRTLVADMGTFCYGCPPRQHPVVGGASDPTGKVTAATWSSILPGGDGKDDVWVVVSRDFGDTWSKPLRANDNTVASRQFQSWVAVDRHGRVHAVWTDTRNGGQNAIYYANTLGDRFGPNVEITDKRGPLAGFHGDYKGIAIQGDDVLVAWADSRNGDNDIYFSRGKGLAGNTGVSVKPEPDPAALKAAWTTSLLAVTDGPRRLDGRKVRPRKPLR